MLKHLTPASIHHHQFSISHDSTPAHARQPNVPSPRGVVAGTSPYPITHPAHLSPTPTTPSLSPSQHIMYSQPLSGARTSFSGPSGGGAPVPGPYASYSSSNAHTTGPPHSGSNSGGGGGAPPLPSPASHPSNHSPLAADMAAWNNTQGGVRPHTADAVFGNGYGGFGGSAPPGMSGPIPPSQRTYGSGSGRMFAYMPQSDDCSPGAAEAYGQQTQAQYGSSSNSQHYPGASPYATTSGSATPYGSSAAPSTAASSIPPSGAGTGASLSSSSASAAAGGGGHKKRPRRRYDEIERLYPCNWPGCTKSYGTLNHLNAHVAMQKHGAKRLPNEFKDMRRAWRKAKREEDQRRTSSSSSHSHMKEQEEAWMRGRIGSLPNPGAPLLPPPQPSTAAASYYHPGPPPLDGMYPPPPGSTNANGGRLSGGSASAYSSAYTSQDAMSSSGSGSISSASGGGPSSVSSSHMPPPGRSYSVGTTAANGYSAGGGGGMHATGLPAADHHHHHGYSGQGGYGGGGSSSSSSHQQHGGYAHHTQSSAPGAGGHSGLGAYLMAHRGSI
ncbi:hypothetical protein V8E36_006575 [Tilletia maclaganii]